MRLPDLASPLPCLFLRHTRVRANLAVEADHHGGGRFRPGPGASIWWHGSSAASLPRRSANRFVVEKPHRCERHARLERIVAARCRPMDRCC